MTKKEITKTESTLSEEEAKEMIRGLFPKNQEEQIEIEEIRIGTREESIYIKVEGESKFDPKTIEKEIGQLKSKHLITKICLPYNYTKNNIEVKYGRYYGSIKFKKINQEEGSVELNINANKEMLNSIIALCFDNSISVCENQISNLQKLFLDKVASGLEDVKKCSDNIVAKVAQRKGFLNRIGFNN